MTARTLMIQGTASNVGKSLLVAALCRIFRQDGFRVAPFKSQNMSNNSYVTADGREIGRAQGVQAEAAGIEATADMNPVLLKPSGEGTSQVVIHGRPYGNLDFRTYRQEGYEAAARAIQESLNRLRSQYDIVVIEGAGSPAEVNLRDRELVNMQVAEWAEAPVLLVGDIDRGGVLAALVGTLALLRPHERERVAGVMINKFRGSRELLEPALTFLTRYTGKPVLGVVPMLPVGIAAEDSLALDEAVIGAAIISHPGPGVSGPGASSPAGSWATPPLRIAAIRFPWIANFTDLDPLAAAPDLNLVWATEARHLHDVDAVILPGTKNTSEDLRWLHRTGMTAAIQDGARAGLPVVGICGGYQMLGKWVRDPAAQESRHVETPGLGLLDVETTFAPMAHKVTARSQGRIRFGRGPFAALMGSEISGYEVHMGRTRLGPGAHPLLEPVDAAPSPGAADPEGRIWGTYFHDVFHNAHLLQAWTDWLWGQRGGQRVKVKPRAETQAPVGHRTAALREQEYDQLAAWVRGALEMDRIYDLLGVRP